MTTWVQSTRQKLNKEKNIGPRQFGHELIQNQGSQITKRAEDNNQDQMSSSSSSPASTTWSPSSYGTSSSGFWNSGVGDWRWWSRGDWCCVSPSRQVPKSGSHDHYVPCAGLRALAARLLTSWKERGRRLLLLMGHCTLSLILNPNGL
jgi:hypothetical protein